MIASWSQAFLLLPYAALLAAALTAAVRGRSGGSDRRAIPGLSGAAPLLLAAVLDVLGYFVIDDIHPGRSVWMFPLEAGERGPGRGLLVADPFSVVFGAGILLWAAVDAAVHKREPRRPVSMYGVALAAMLVVGANDLLLLWVGIEILVLAAGAHLTHDSKHVHGAVHGFFSAIALFGVALMFGLFGTTNLFELAASLSMRNVDIVPSVPFAIGAVFLIGGLAFRICRAVSVWLGDPRRNDPPDRMPFVFSVVVAAAYAALLRLLVLTFPPDLSGAGLHDVTLVVGGALGLIGGALTVGSTDLHRGLYRSVVAHLGIAVLALIPRTGFAVIAGTGYALFHLALTFAAVPWARGRSSRPRVSSNEAGPGTARTMVPAVVLSALAGVPLTGGFVARFFVLGALLEDPGVGLWPAAIAGIVWFLLLYAYGGWLRDLYLHRRRSSTIWEEGRPSLIGMILIGGAVAGLVLALPAGYAVVWDLARLLLGAD